jgi:flagellar FliL protein
MSDAATAEEEIPEGLPVTKKLSGKKLVLFVVLPVLLIAGAATGAFMLGLFDSRGDAAAAPEAEHLATPGHFVELEDMLVNLNSTGRKTIFLKIGISLELEQPKDAPKIEAVMPRIVDYFQLHLRGLRVEDLQGAEGMYRLREELLARANAATEPARVRDVLFRELLVQQ